MKLEKLWQHRRLLSNYAWRRLQGGRLRRPPVFIVGCGHSGTSITLAVLGAHSRMYAIPTETNLATFADAEARRRMRRFAMEAIAAGKERWIEKTPSHIRSMERLFALQPGARVLLITRDGRDVVHSLMRRGSNLSEAVSRWITDNEAGRAFWNDARVWKFRYEDFVGDFEPTLRGMLDFLGEPFEAGLREHYRQPIPYQGVEKIERPADRSDGASHNQYRAWQVNQPLFDGRGSGKALAAEDLAVVEEKAGYLLRELGYAAEEG